MSYYIDPSSPIQSQLTLLRFRHNVERKVIVDPVYSFDKSIEYAIRTKGYTPSGLVSIDFWSSIEVPMICTKVYTGTTATLFAPDGNYLRQVTTHLHPSDQFCKLTGREIIQQRIILLLGTDPLFIPDPLASEILARLLLNKTAQPLNW